MKDVMGRVVIDPEILSGKPIIKGTRIPVYLIIELLDSGLTRKEVIRQYPSLKSEDIKAAVLFTANRREKAGI